MNMEEILMKNSEDFKKKVNEENIKEWRITECSKCGYECGFVFKQDEVYYDNGCYCEPDTSDFSPELQELINDFEGLRKTSYEEVAEVYNKQDNPQIIQEMNEFWGFKNEKED